MRLARKMPLVRLVDESGATTTEYGVMLALILVAALVAIYALQGAIIDLFQTATNVVTLPA